MTKMDKGMGQECQKNDRFKARICAEQDKLNFLKGLNWLNTGFILSRGSL